MGMRSSSIPLALVLSIFLAVIGDTTPYPRERLDPINNEINSLTPPYPPYRPATGQEAFEVLLSRAFISVHGKLVSPTRMEVPH
jgi:hypothetical protein